jgi:hypothetical protein
MGKLFKSIGKVLLGLAPAVAAGGIAITPAAAVGIPGTVMGIMGAILRAVTSAQAGYPADANEAKRTEVEGAFETIAAIAGPMAAAMGGGDADDERIKVGCSKIAEGILDLMKGLRVFATKESAAK